MGFELITRTEAIPTIFIASLKSEDRILDSFGNAKFWHALWAIPQPTVLGNGSHFAAGHCEVTGVNFDEAFGHFGSSGCCGRAYYNIPKLKSQVPSKKYSALSDARRRNNKNSNTKYRSTACWLLRHNGRTSDTHYSKHTICELLHMSLP